MGLEIGMNDAYYWKLQQQKLLHRWQITLILHAATKIDFSSKFLFVSTNIFCPTERSLLWFFDEQEKGKKPDLIGHTTVKW